MPEQEILALIQKLSDTGYFHVFENREDFVEGRTDWDDLKDTAEQLYYTLMTIKDLLNNPTATT